MQNNRVTDEMLLAIPQKAIININRNSDRLLLMNFTASNKALVATCFEDINLFSAYVTQQLKQADARYGIGGYNEHRALYGRSNLFNGNIPGEEPRRLHLGIDIWGYAGEPIFAPLDGLVHSFAFNNAFGDYGATIILQHSIFGQTMYSLFGHLSLQDLDGLREGQKIEAGTLFAHFGEPNENGHWPPHLHFQLIHDLEGKKGDYPGVCKLSESNKYLNNCPNPDLLINLMELAY